MPDVSAASLPRPLRIALVALAAIALTGLFIYLGFPYDLLAARLSSRIEQSTGMQLSYGPVTASPQLQGPGIAVADLRARTASGDTWELHRLVLRPAWSLSWFKAQPAVHLDADAPFGRVAGVALLSSAPAFDGEASALDLAALLRAAAPQTGLTGTADVDADVAFGPDGAAGPVRLSARDGVISHPGIPFDVPYESIDAELVLGGGNLLEIVSCDVRSPMGTGSIQGTFGAARAMSAAPLDLRVSITAAEDIRPMLQAQRVPVGADGRIDLKISGSLARPVVR